MSFEEWYDQHFGSQEDKEAALASAATAEIDPSRLDYSPEGDQVEKAVGSVFQSVRDAPGWAAKRIYRGATRTDLPPPPSDPYGWSFNRAARNFWDMTGEGPSAREQELAGVAPPVPSDWSFKRAVENFHPLRDLHNLADRMLDAHFKTSGGGADSNLQRQLWEYQAPAEQLKTKYLEPDFTRDWPDTAARPSALPSPPGVGLGPVGRFVNEAFQPVTDPMSLKPMDLVRGFREGILSDEDLRAIRENPSSPRAMAAYAQAAIMLSKGEGGERVPFEQKPGAIPENVWNTFKIAPPYDDPKIRVDNAGNHFEYVGSHNVVDPETGREAFHVIAKPVEAPGAPYYGTDMFQHMVDSSTTWEQLGPNQKQWFLDQWKLGNKPSAGSVPDEPSLAEAAPSIHDPSNPHFDQTFTDWWKKVYPEDFKGDKFIGGPSKEPLNLLGGGPSSPSKAHEPGDMWDEWAKKHGGLKPDFTGGGNAAVPLPPPPGRGDLGALEPDVIIPPTEGVRTNDPLDNMLSDWAKMMDEKGIDYGKPAEPGLGNTKAQQEWKEALDAGDITWAQYDAALDAIGKGQMPPLPPDQPPIDPKMKADWDNIYKWNEKRRKEKFNKDRWNWTPED